MRRSHPFFDNAFIERQKTRDIPDLYLPNAETFVAVSAGRVVGFIALLGSEIGALFVAPGRQRCGIGKALLDHVRTRHEGLTLEVFEANLTARAFYHRYGFHQTGTRIHEEVGEPLLCLKLLRDAKS